MLKSINMDESGKPMVIPLNGSQNCPLDWIIGKMVTVVLVI
jgi:hypothetical protein